MPLRHRIREIVFAVAIILQPACAVAGNSDYPSRPIRVIVPFGPGGASDFIGRLLTAKFPDVFGQQGVIDNRPGAAGNVALELAAKSPPDGYNLFLGNVGTIAVNANLYKALTVRPLRDLAPVVRLATIPGIMVAHPSFPANSVPDLVALAAKQPGAFNYGSPGAGSSQRILMELFKKLANINLVEVPYKGGAGPATVSVLAGETQLAFATVASVINYVKDGTLKPLATLTERRLKDLPNVPTMVDAGFPRILDGQWQGIFVPAGTPDAIIDKLATGLSAIMREPSVLDRLASVSAEPYLTTTAKQFAAFVATENEKWAAIIAETGATAD